MRPAANGSKSAGTWLAVGLSAGCAAGLLYLAVPRAVAALLALPGNPAGLQMQTQGSIDPQAAGVLRATRQRYLLWANSPRAWAQLGYAQRTLAYTRPGPDRRPDPQMLERAAASYEKALGASPADPTAWSNLAFLRYALSGPTASATAAFSMALLTGPVMIRQTAFRLDLAFRLWPSLSAEDRRLVMQVIRTGWLHVRDDIVGLADSPARAGIVRAALISDAEALAAFEALHAKRPKPARE